ncbi:MAG: three-Cys-motif partner protein TcmP [Spirochaetales bacterium]|nr:three-Cys-motif partner protein TcmP [Spirochaetales bacterium]
MSDFFEKEYDESTQLKLAIFQGYIKEWISVFLTQSKSFNYKQINIFDFFSGSGTDVKGNPGSPIIIVKELKKYCQSRSDFKIKQANIQLFFNDKNSEYIKRLIKALHEIKCGKSCCNFNFSSKLFQDILPEYLPYIHNANSANLIILDQFGVSDVTPETVEMLSTCSATDIIFFISSSFIKRFNETPELSGFFNFQHGEIKEIEYKSIHRFICSYFRKKINKQDYYLSPFSIKKGSNIYGLIFGSSNLYGLEKFLKVCWKIDKATGEANYNIDDDFSWENQSIFEELNIISKLEVFKTNLLLFIQKNQPDNNNVYRFCLSAGFLPKHVREIIKPLRDKNEIIVKNLLSEDKVRLNAYYLSYRDFNEKAKIKYILNKKSEKECSQ